MSDKGNAITGIIGLGMSTAPSVVDKPFYETDLWLSSMAVMGMVLLVLSIINGFLSFRRKRRDMKKNG